MTEARPGQLTPMRAFYFLSFGALGSLFPYLPLVLASRGLDAAQISWVMVLLPASSIFIPPLWGTLADRRRARIALLGAASVGCALCVLLLLPASGLAGSLLAMAAFSFFRAPLTALADAATTSALGDRRAAFGRVRVWGSVGFAAFVLVMGLLEGPRHPTLLLSTCALVYLGSALCLVTIKTPHASPRRERGVVRETLRVVARLPLPLFLLGIVLYYCGHSTYDLFFALHARALGHGDRFIGAAWTVGVGIEIGVMLLAPSLLGRTRGGLLLTGCAAVAALRWLLLSSLSGWGLIPAQALHGITFGLWYLSLVQYIQDRAPERLRTSLQSVAVSCMGLGQIGGYLAGGIVFHRLGGAQLYRMAACCAGAAILLYLLCAALSRRSAGSITS